MAVKERDVVLMGKDGADQTIDLPVTRLGNIENSANTKTSLADADTIPAIDSADGQEMKKISWANLVTAIKSKLTGVYEASGAVATHNTASSAHSALFAGKASASALTDHTGSKSNPHGVTKAQVGLGNVDNTSDANKPISTATQTALNGKAASSHTHGAGNITSGTLAADRLPTVPVSKGGTGATAAAAARTNLGAAARMQWTNINVPTTAWAQNSTDKYYYATVSVSGMLATDNPHSVDIVRSADAAADALCDEAFGAVDRIETLAGSIKLRAPDGKPTVAFKLWMEATR